MRYTIEREENGDYVAIWDKHQFIIGVGDTKREAVKELKIFAKEYKSYVKEELKKWKQ